MIETVEGVVGKHDMDQVWSSVKELQGGQSKTQTEVSALGARMGGVENKLDSLASMLTTYVTQPKKDFNYMGLFSVLLSVSVAAGMLASAHLHPVKEKAENNRITLMEHHRQAIAEARENGQQDSDIDTLMSLVLDLKERAHTVEQQVSAGEQHGIALEKWLKAIDDGGSRRWIGEGASK